MTPKKHADRAKENLFTQFQKVGDFSKSEIELFVDDILAAAKPDTEVKIQSEYSEYALTELGHDIARQIRTEHPSPPLIDDQAREIQILREQRDALARLVERALCGCYALDCVEHGAYSVLDIAVFNKVTETNQPCTPRS